MVTISTHVGRHATYRALAERHRPIFFTVGTHPHNAAEEPDTAVDEIVALSRHDKCVAIGEAGLDFFYDKSPRAVQRRVFLTHIAAAQESGLPAAMRDKPFGAILHCFSSGPELARVGLELGFYLSFSGMLTFKRSDELRAIAASAPLGQLLVETDAPYLAPEPYRGKPNEPAYVAKTAEVLAKVKGLTLGELAAVTTANAERIFPRLKAAASAAAA
jgi:TatD DNase family protein